METLELGRWVIEHDVRATRAVYDAASGGAHRCECAHCRNFVAVRDQAYPRGFLELLLALGIDPHKEAEIAEFGPKDGGRLYQGWYHFIGRVLQDPEDLFVFSEHDPEWSVFFAPGRGLAHPEFGNQPLVQVDWSAVLPWQLAEPPE